MEADKRCKLHNLALFENVFYKRTLKKHIPDLDPLKGARLTNTLIVLRGAKCFSALPLTLE
jgi:hypothetical protein